MPIFLPCPPPPLLHSQGALNLSLTVNQFAFSRNVREWGHIIYLYIAFWSVFLLIVITLGFIQDVVLVVL